MPRKLTQRSAAVSYRAVLCAAVFSGYVSGAAFAAPPQRIVSLNLCVDQILVDLVAAERIAAVTHLAADAAVSAMPSRFAKIAATRGAAEDVLSREPDLIIAGLYTTPATVDLLRRLGQRVVVVPLPDSIAGVRDLIGQIAAAVEAPEAGRAMVAEMDARLAQARRDGDSTLQPSAVVYQINNYVTGRGSLIDEALAMAGFRNAGREMAKLASGKSSLETLVATPPDLLVTATAPGDYATVVGDNLRHPALALLPAATRRLVLPWSLSLCGTQHIATAVERLAEARATLTAAPRAPHRPAP